MLEQPVFALQPKNAGRNIDQQTRSNNTVIIAMKKKKTKEVDVDKLVAGICKIGGGTVILLGDLMYPMGKAMELKDVSVNGTPGESSNKNLLSGQEIVWMTFFGLVGVGLIYWGIVDEVQVSNDVAYNKPLIYPYLCSLDGNSFCYGVGERLKF